ncbi:hypothetical protein EI94DRAFT_1817664 [Lactarius quietus]|nr:hypothetical protein EI94DRAFT_1817664 [Lactarius quietus]
MSSSPDVNIRNSLGAAFIGLIFSTTLYGVAILQTWVYFWNYGSRDHKALKCFIVAITIMDTALAVLRAYLLYWYLILNFGNVESLDFISWALSAQLAIAIIVVASVQIEAFMQDKFILGAFAAVGLSFGFVTVAKQFTLKQFSKFDAMIWDPCVGIAAIALANLLIAGAICWSLYHKKTETDSKILVVSSYTVSSGLLTSILSVAALISFAVSPSSMIYLAFLWVMGDCAVNSMLVLLNSRDYVRPTSAVQSKNPRTHNLTSIRFEQQGDESKNTQTTTTTSITADVAGSAASGIIESKSGDDAGLTFAVPKPGTSIISSNNHSRTSISSAPGL